MHFHYMCVHERKHQEQSGCKAGFAMIIKEYLESKCDSEL